jgi:excisionase family DNA binding protein
MTKPNGILADYLTPEQLARELNLAPITLARWRSHKKGPPFTRSGRQVLYSKEGVKKWLERTETKPQN